MANPACTSCGTETEPDARFCGVCGTRIERPVRAPSALDATMPDLRASAERRQAALSEAPPGATVPLQRPDLGPGPGSPALAAVAAVRNAPAAARTSAPPGAFAPRGHAPNLTPATVPGRSLSPAPSQAPRRIGTRPPLPSLDRLMGTTLNGRYLVEKKIGEGGFGAVFRGRQVATGREVALKILHPHNVGDATVVARFRREAEACSKLRNQHTVTIYDFDETEDGTLYLAMELLRGRPLQDVERLEGPLDPRRALGIMSQVADALGEAHGHGIVHRDMKPENVMVETREGEDFVKVLDFGIAKLGDSGGKPAPALTAVGQTLGTLEFMSPEQLRGRPLDGRSDLYALGIMAFEMLTGLLPWREARVPIDVIKFHLEVEPPLPSELRRELHIPREVDEIVAKMVAKDPNDRHADAADLRQHIEDVLDLLARRAGRTRVLKIAGVAAGVLAGMALLFAAGLALLR